MITSPERIRERGPGMKWSADPALLRDPVHLLAFGFGAGLSP